MICVLVLLWTVVHQGHSKPEKAITYTELMKQIDSGTVKNVVISGTEAHGDYTDNLATFKSQLPSNYQDVVKALDEHKINLEFKDSSSTPWMSVLINVSPFILLLAFWIFMMRQMQSGGNKALSFGKSRARLHTSQQKKVTFKDVAGVEEAKEELQEIIEFLREPAKFQKLGGRIPKGVLLIGAPGTGKTLLARAIAGEASVPFFSISGSDFVEMFVGAGASRGRDLFEQAKQDSP
ncbi:MAG TPA: cell division protein FtsH, partial [Solibacterales bacterium]|nr:cell division protein FtsH [Bryobacterales bacterium]